MRRRSWMLRAIAALGSGMLVAGVLVGSVAPAVAATADAAAPTIFILDASGSMVRDADDGSRMDVAKSALNQTIAAMPSATEVGVLVFGTGTGNDESERAAGCSDVKTLAPMAAVDPAALKSQIDGVEASGFTPIGPALRQAITMLPQGEVGNIVLISDGVDTCAPPSSCEIASEVHRDNPLVSINVVAFGVDDDEAAQQQMTCIGGVGGGTAVTATNAEQLIARLRAVSDTSAASTNITTTGIRGVDLGMNLDEVRARVDGAQVGEETVENGVRVIFVECSWGTIELHDNRVVAITPREATPTAEGLAPGDDVERATTLYGAPVDSSTTSNVYQARPGSASGYRVSFDTAAGTITTIVICRCVPTAAISTNIADWEITFDGMGPLVIGMSRDEAQAAVPALRESYDALIIPGDNVGDLLSAFFVDDALASITVRDYTYADRAAAVGAAAPSARGIRLGESGATAENTYPGGTYYRNLAGGISAYMVADREGRLLTFGGLSIPEDTATGAASGHISDITVEDATRTRVPYVPPVEEAAPEPSAADPLTGEWCTRSGADCFSYEGLVAEHPGTFVDSETAMPDGSVQYRFCLTNNLDDGCDMASTAIYQFLPAGVGWDCLDAAAEVGLTSCEPDFTAAHDASQPRLRQVPNHQQGTEFFDTEPMYLQ